VQVAARLIKSGQRQHPSAATHFGHPRTPKLLCRNDIAQRIVKRSNVFDQIGFIDPLWYNGFATSKEIRDFNRT
jgi:hypothetical protein